MRLALVHVGFAARSGKALGTVAGEGTGRVDADAVVLARGTLITLVNILGTVDALVAHRAGTRKRPVDRAGITDCIRVARIRGACVVQMAQQSRLARRTPTVEATDSVDTRSSVETGRVHTIVNVVATVGPVPPVHADTVVPAVGVGTGGPILADRRLLNALVHVRVAIVAGKARRTLAVIGIDPVHAGATVLTHIARTVVDVLLAVFTLEAWWTFAFVVEFRRLLASAPVLAGRRRTGNVVRLAVFPSVSGFTVALVRSVRVDTRATVDARVLDALLDILGARQTLEPLRAHTLDVSVDGQRASASVSTRRRRAEVLLVAVFSRIPGGAVTRVLAKASQLAGTTVVARRRITRVLDRNFAEALGEPDRTPTGKRRNAVRKGHLADPTVLTPGTGTDVTRIRKFTEITGMPRRTVAVGPSVRFADACSSMFARRWRTRQKAGSGINQNNQEQSDDEHINPSI